MQKHLSLEMDIFHVVSNWEIETTHSSSQEEEVEMEVRNWLELPSDVMSLILLKLGPPNVLISAQWVCTSWWKLSKQPHLFRTISIEKILVPSNHEVPLNVSFQYCKFMFMVKIAREAVDRSCGQLVEISVRTIADDELLQYISQKSQSLKCLRLANCNRLTDDGLIKVCEQFLQLEELELCSCPFSEDVLYTVGLLCPHLKSFRINYLCYTCSYMLDETALAIAETMPELHNLNLFGNRLTDYGLRAILHGCPHLQTLDLRRCVNLKFEGDLKEISANIKLRLPYDSIDDFEYVIEKEFYDDYDENAYYVDEEDDAFYCGSD